MEKLKCKVVMLTNDELIKKGHLIFDQIYPHKASCDHQEVGSFCKNAHLYFVSDREIKEGDWFLSDDRLTIYTPAEYKVQKCIKIQNGWIYRHISQPDESYNPDWSFKIEITTDSTLGLPLIPQSFVEKYVAKQGGIEYVMINILQSPDRTEYIIQIRSDNTVICSAVKDAWNREEVKALLLQAYNRGEEDGSDDSTGWNTGTIEEWIEQQL